MEIRIGIGIAIVEVGIETEGIAIGTGEIEIAIGTGAVGTEIGTAAGGAIGIAIPSQLASEIVMVTFASSAERSVGVSP